MKYFIADKYGNCCADNVEAPNEEIAQDILESRYTKEEIDRDELDVFPYDEDELSI